MFNLMEYLYDPYDRNVTTEWRALNRPPARLEVVGYRGRRFADLSMYTKTVQDDFRGTGSLETGVLF